MMTQIIYFQFHNIFVPISSNTEVRVYPLSGNIHEYLRRVWIHDERRLAGGYLCVIIFTPGEFYNRGILHQGQQQAIYGLYY